MANKQINQLVSKTGILGDSDYLMVYDSAETGSEKTKKVAISDYVKVIDEALTLYISPSGSDTTGNGTSGSPWATIGKAIEWISTKIIGHNSFVTIQLADGTYNNQSTVSFRYPYGARLAIVGNETTPANVTLNYSNGQRGFYVFNNAFLRIKGLKLVGNSQETDGVLCSYFGSVLVTDCIVDNWNIALQLYVNGAAHFKDCTLNNSNSDGIFANVLSNAYIDGCTISNNTVGAAADRASDIYVYSSSFSGNSSNTTTAHNGRVMVE